MPAMKKATKGSPFSYQDKSEIVFDLTVLDLELAVLQERVADEGVAIAIDQLLRRQQVGARIEQVDTVRGVAHRYIVHVAIGSGVGVRVLGERITHGARTQQ